MKKYASVFFQIIFGFFSVNLFWVIGFIINDPYGDFRFTKFEELLFEIPWFVSVLLPVCISLLTIIFGFIGKKYKLKIMFWILFFSTLLPIIGYLIMRLCSNDSSMISLILLPLLLMLQPFGIMCMGMLDNITMTLNDNILTSFDESFWIVLIISSLVISLFMYMSTKPKDNQKQPIKKNKTGETNQGDQDQSGETNQGTVL